MARIEMIGDKSQLSEDRFGEFDAIVAVLNRVGGPFSILMHSPGLAQKVMEAGAHVRLNSTLTMAERELIILAVSREKDGVYEWAAHVVTARNVGTREVAITAVRDGADVSGLEPDERDIITYVRQLLQTNRVEDDLFAALLDRHGPRWVVELTGTIGQYQYIAAINNAFEVLPAPDAEQLPVGPR